jgi:hypothetical protein
MATINVKDAGGATVPVEKPLPPNRVAATLSRPVVLCNEDKAVIDALETAMEAIQTAIGAGALARGGGVSDANTLRVVVAEDQLGGSEYETVAASASDQVLGATGAQGDYLDTLVCVVTTAATSQVQIKDGNGTLFPVLPNNVGAGIGTYHVAIGAKCVNGTTPGWKITTGAGVTVFATGNFT